MRTLVCLAALLVSTPAFAALNVYLTLTGGLEGTVEVAEVRQDVASPRDAASGLPTGKRQHKPIYVTLNLDKSSPLLRGLAQGATVTEAQFGRSGGDSVTLKKGYITARRAGADGRVHVVVRFEDGRWRALADRVRDAGRAPAANTARPPGGR